MVSNPFSLFQKTILVTGASSGIGRQVAILCSEMGAKVILLGRNEEQLQVTLTRMSGKEHSIIIADLTQDFSRISDKILTIDGIVHSAGKYVSIPFQYLSKELMTEMFQINFFSPVLLTQLLLKEKKFKTGSSIVFISSLAGNVVSSYGNSIYGSSKSALNGIMKGLALELSRKKIRVNSVLPGMVKTEMIQTFLESLTEDQLLQDENKYPLGYGNPEDVANLCIYLLSDSSKWMTGSSLVIDGGFSLL